MKKETMNKSSYNQAKEKSWVKPLSAEENAELRRFLTDNPDLQQDWQEDVALTSALNRVPHVPVSSNFTARVMQAVQREEAQAGHKKSPWRKFWRRGWIPKFAIAAAMLCLGTFSVHEYNVVRANKQLATQVAEVKQFAETAPIPQVEWLKDFDTIEQMSKVQVADNDILMAKQ